MRRPPAYAAYGSNLHPLRLAERTPTARLLGTAHLPGWSLSFHKKSRDESGKCTVHRGGDGVHFAIFSMSAGDKVALDSIEGLGRGYDEIRLEVPKFGSCFSYIAQESFVDESLVPYDWYKALVLAGAEFHGFPDDYRRRIAAAPARPDPDLERGAGQWALAETMTTTRL